MIIALIIIAACALIIIAVCLVAIAFAIHRLYQIAGHDGGQGDRDKE